MLKHCLIVFGVSMVPLIELRGAIPYGVAFDLPLWLTFAIAIVGNMLPVPIIYFFARKVLVWGSDKKFIGKFFTWCLEKGEKAGKKLQAKAGLLDMDFKKGVLACMGGVLLAGVIRGVLSVLGVGIFTAAKA